MAELVITAQGPIKRIVRSKRTFQGVQVGAIHDKGYLVMVRQMGESTAWFPIHVIRKLSSGVSFQVGQTVNWITRPVPSGYLQGTVIKLGAKKVCIEVKTKMGERRIKWANAEYLKSV